MIHSLFMFVGSYNKNRKVSALCILGWIGYMFLNYNYTFGMTFPIVNLLTFLVVTIGINLIGNRKANTILSIISILIWSIIIDIICYFLFPFAVGNQSIIAYVFNGILYNYKYVFFNITAFLIWEFGDGYLEEFQKRLERHAS